MIPLAYPYAVLYQNQPYPPSLPVASTLFVVDRFSIARVNTLNQFSIPMQYFPLQSYSVPLLYPLFQPETESTLPTFPPFLQVDNYSEYLDPYKSAVITKVAVPCVRSAIR